MKTVYFDYNATTPLHPNIKKILDLQVDNFGNPGSTYAIGQDAEALLVQSKEKIADFIGATIEDLVFTSCGTESNNTVLFQLFVKKLQGKTPHLVCSTIEHSSILEYSSFLKEVGVKVDYIPVDNNGFIDTVELGKVVTEDSLVSLILANNEIGTIQNYQEIVKVVKGKGAFLHFDATQFIGKLPFSVKEVAVDFLTFASHKIYGPRGIAALYVKRGTKFQPMILGGGQQEEKRAGTENQLLLAAFAEAIECRMLEMTDEYNRLHSYRRYFINKLKEYIPTAVVNGPTETEQVLPGTISITIPGVPNDTLFIYLDMAGYAISTGSACSSRSFKPSQVLLAIGKSEIESFQTIRVSMGKDTTKEDIDGLIEEMSKIVKRILKQG